MSAKADFLEQLNASLLLEQAAREPAPQGGAGETLERVMPPQYKAFADMDYWYLTSPLDWTWEDPSRAPIAVPVGFTTDFASVPSMFWSVVPPTGRYGLAAVVHDWLYWQQSLKRAEADQVFHDAMAELQVPGWKRFVMTKAVRWFGGSYWHGNTHAKLRGEKRVLKAYPDDVKISWDVWRKTPDVFV